MENNVLLSELTKNCEKHKARLLELMEIFDLAELGYDLQEQRCKDVHNRVFAEHEFFAKMDVKRLGISKGDRIKDDDGMWLLSEEDFDRFFKIAIPILAEEKITDENGTFLENWNTQIVIARKELVEFLLTEVVPISMRKGFESCRWNIVHSNKLIEAFRSCVKAA